MESYNIVHSFMESFRGAGMQVAEKITSFTSNFITTDVTTIYYILLGVIAFFLGKLIYDFISGFSIKLKDNIFWRLVTSAGVFFLLLCL